MRPDIVPGGIFPDYELTDHTKTRRRLSELQGIDPMIPYTLVLKPGLVIYSIYNGYWFWGREAGDHSMHHPYHQADRGRSSSAADMPSTAAVPGGAA